MFGLGLVCDFFTFREGFVEEKLYNFVPGPWPQPLSFQQTTLHPLLTTKRQPMRIHPHYPSTHKTTRPGGMGVNTAVTRSRIHEMIFRICIGDIYGLSGKEYILPISRFQKVQWVQQKNLERLYNRVVVRSVGCLFGCQ